MDPAGNVKGEAAISRSQLSAAAGHGAHTTCSRGCLRPVAARAAGVAVAARRDGPRRSSEAAVAAAWRRWPRRRRETSIVLAAIGRLHGRAARGVLASFLKRDPVAADVLAAGLDAAALETIIQSRRLARRRPGAAATAEEAREVAGGCWWARGRGRRWARGGRRRRPRGCGGEAAFPKAAAAEEEGQRRLGGRGRRGPCWCGPTTGRRPGGRGGELPLRYRVAVT